MRDGHVTYELTFPNDLSFERATQVFAMLGGLDRPAVRHGRPESRPMVVLELLAVPGKFKYFISFWPHLADSIIGSLRGVVPEIGLQLASPTLRSWDAVVELQAGETTPGGRADRRVIQVILSSLGSLRSDEAVLVQFVCSPRGPSLDDSKQTFAVVGRIATVGQGLRARELVRQVMVPYRRLAVSAYRELPPPLASERVTYRAAPLGNWPMAMTADELVVVCAIPVGSPQVAGLGLGRGKRLAPEPHVPSRGRRIGRSNFLGAERPLALAPEDRHKHLYLIGPTGTGKSTIMENMAVADIKEGEGLAFIDPKGPSVEQLLDRVPEHRRSDVILYDLADPDTSVGLNVLEGENPHVIAGQLVSVFAKVFDLSNAPRAVNILRPTLLTLAQQGYTLCEVPLILEPSARGRMFRARAMAAVTDPELGNFWYQFEGLTPKEQAERTDAILHRVSALLLYPQLRASLGQRRSGFDLSRVVRDKKILLVPLPTESIPEEMAHLVGSLITMKLWNAVRAQKPHEDFYLYIDEFEAATQLPISLGQMFSQARGFRLGMTVGHQHVNQLPPAMRSEIFSNVRSKLALQLETKDARIMAEQFGEPVQARDLVNLGPYEAIARLAAGGNVGQPVTVSTYPPSPHLGEAEGVWAEEVRRSALARWGRPTVEVLRELAADSGDRTGVQPSALPETPIGWEEVTE